jgi:anti-sigma regulatory factor (Ser/Thr protein kinase)
MDFSAMSDRAGTVREPAAAGSAERDSGAGPVFQSGDECSNALMTLGWPFQSHLELGALPSAVPCARLHARQVLWEWKLSAVAEPVELLVSELVTNAVQASADLPGGRDDRAYADGMPTVRFWLAADPRRVLVQVWDRCRSRPQRQEPRPEAESGRGLLLVEALSSEWGSFTPKGWNGKLVWALVTRPEEAETS